MKTLVTGGAGFIGSHLIEKLLKRGDEIVVLDNLSNGSLHNISRVFDKIKFIKGDILNDKDLAEAMEDVSVVYHLAALLGAETVVREPEKTYSINFEGTKKVMDAARKKGVTQLLFSSTSEVYGARGINANEDEAQPQTLYAISKFQAEEYARSMSDTMTIVGVRYFNVYGPRQRSGRGWVVPDFIDAALNGRAVKVHNSGTQLRDLNYIDDVVDLTMEVLDDKNNGSVFNVGSGRTISVLDLAQRVVAMTGSRSPIVHVPERRKADLHSKSANPARLRTATGDAPRTFLEEGLLQTIDDYSNGPSSDGGDLS